jgi:hypothetical protein
VRQALRAADLAPEAFILRPGEENALVVRVHDSAAEGGIHKAVFGPCRTLRTGGLCQAEHRRRESCGARRCILPLCSEVSPRS